tara:strand:- start:656 stop:1792 length:1137 start_codon:yes stop_codon:yes gene_type:complete
MKEIPFASHPVIGNDLEYTLRSSLLGKGQNKNYSEKVEQIIEEQLELKNKRVLLTTSCTHALEICAILMNFKKGDEVIIPSYTFVSTALAFQMHSAKVVFCDSKFDNFNIDEDKIERLINKKTKAIIVVHYGGIACEMDKIMRIAEKNNLIVIEDNAHGLYAKYKNRYLGSIGHLSTLSFHSTKNLSCGEGGALIVNDNSFLERAHIIRDKGTNRKKFNEKKINKYKWIDKGSSYVISEFLSSILIKQLKYSNNIQNKRKKIWNRYNSQLKKWALTKKVKLQKIPYYCDQSYHMFYLFFQSKLKRDNFLEYLNKNSIKATTHYEPLHLSPFAKKNIDNKNKIISATKISRGIVRLPLSYNMSDFQVQYIIDKILKYDD